MSEDSVVASEWQDVFRAAGFDPGEVEISVTRRWPRRRWVRASHALSGSACEAPDELGAVEGLVDLLTGGAYSEPCPGLRVWGFGTGWHILCEHCGYSRSNVPSEPEANDIATRHLHQVHA